MESNRTSLGALLLVAFVAFAGLMAAFDTVSKSGRGGSVSKIIRTTLG